MQIRVQEKIKKWLKTRSLAGKYQYLVLNRTNLSYIYGSDLMAKDGLEKE
jgi:hypothetical protein